MAKEKQGICADWLPYAREDTIETKPVRADFRIRPLWLIGGGVTVMVLGVCALLSLSAAGVIIWLTLGRSSNATQATQVALQRQTEPGVTVASPTISIPTPLLAISTLPPPPTWISGATQNTALRSAPEQAVRTYYQLVSQQRYDLTWPLLTDAFKQKFNCCSPTFNYTGYVSWWDSVNYVDFGDVRTVSESGERAVVYAELYFVMNSGERSAVDSNPYIALVYDAATGTWRFDDKRAFP